MVGRAGRQDGERRISQRLRHQRVQRRDWYLYHKSSIKGVFTFIIKDGDHIVSEWMMFTFVADSYTGQNVSESEEGKLQWHDVNDIQNLPMAPGDGHILDFMMKGQGLLHGTFTYTPEFELLSYRLDPQHIK